MEKNHQDGNLTADDKQEDVDKQPGEHASAVSRRQILQMGWSIPAAVGFTALFSNRSDAMGTHSDGGGGGSGINSPKYTDHNDVHGDTHGDHTDVKYRPSDVKMRPIDKQTLTQNILKLKQEIKDLQAQLNQAQDGQDLGKVGAEAGIKKLKESLQALSKKISDVKAKQADLQNIQKLSDGAGRSVKTTTELEQAIAVDNKAAALDRLNQLSKNLSEVESALNQQ